MRKREASAQRSDSILGIRSWREITYTKKKFGHVYENLLLFRDTITSATSIALSEGHGRATLKQSKKNTLCLPQNEKESRRRAEFQGAYSVQTRIEVSLGKRNLLIKCLKVDYLTC